MYSVKYYKLSEFEKIKAQNTIKLRFQNLNNFFKSNNLTFLSSSVDLCSIFLK